MLGIDPGSIKTGYGLLDSEGNRLRHIAHGLIKPKETDFMKRLHGLFKGLSEVIATYNPDVVAIEDVFMAKNASSALKLGQARGALIAACYHAGLEAHTYSPTAVKLSVVGFGRAEKQQVQHMIQRILAPKEKMTEDAADALAVAVCHAHNIPLLRRQVS
ncbi:MAG: crossover junction endodeoxyribonuclease RuvC [Mariprofundaceae bacterium]|nr:crossover junction endodeoxyribonuclease RuvC [Mariprofundaceae bacterium]